MQIAVWTAGGAGLAFVGDADRLTFVYAGRNAHFHNAFFHLPAGAATRGAMFFHNRSLAATLRASGDHAKHAAKSLLGDASLPAALWADHGAGSDRKSTRLNSSHGYISYAVFCLKKKIY